MSTPVIDPKTSTSKWRKILKLGEDLLCANQGEINQIEVHKHSLIVNLAAQVLGAQATFWMPSGISAFPSSTDSRASPIDQHIESDIQKLTPLMRRSLNMRRICCSEHSNQDTCIAGLESIVDGNVFAMAAPLISQDLTIDVPHILGILQVERITGVPFDLEDGDLFEGLISQGALGLNALNQMEIERWRLDQLSLVRKVSAEIAHLHDLDQLSQRVTELILKTFRYYYTAIFTLEKGKDRLQFRASAGPQVAGQDLTSTSTEISSSPVVNAKIGHGIIGNVASSGVEIIANDVRQESRFLFEECLPETLSEAALPLKVQDRLVGVLDVQSDQPGDFLETDMLILRTLASNIAIAIENARIYSKLQYRADHLSIIGEVGRAITSMLDQDELIAEITVLIQKRFGYPFVHLFNINPINKKIEFAAGSGEISQKLQESKLTYDLDDPKGIIPWVARNAESRLVNDVQLEPLYRPAIFLPDEACSELCVPLLFAGRVLGVLDIQSNEVGAFSDDDRTLFESLADNIALALRNAQLFRSEQWRRKAADSLREVAGLLSEDVDLNVVLNSILVELDRTLPSDIAAIWLLNKEQAADPENGIPGLNLAAVHSLRKDIFLIKVGSSPWELILINPELSTHLDPALATSWLMDAMNSSQPIFRTAETPYEPIGAVLGFQPSYSAIAAPLRVGERILGVLTIIHHASGKYGDEAQLFTAAYASYAAVAIENTRLYEAAHEQAWISSVLLQVSEAIQSYNNINELLNSVIEFTLMLAGVKGVALYLADQEGTYTPFVSAGLSSEAKIQFMRWRFVTGDVPILDRIREEPAPVILGNNQGDRILTSIFLEEAGKDTSSSDQDVIVLVPVSARQEIMGVLLIHNRKETSQTAPDFSHKEFFDRTLPILQGIADQTAVALENIRLLESQKNEAYISASLLQVARAVANSNDLSEALPVVAQLIPRLTGVDRVAFFLWDNAEQKFHLNGAYGVPQADLGISFGSGEFGLLDAALEINQVIAIHLPAIGIGDEHPIEGWSGFADPEQLSNAELIKSSKRLLIAFPLMIKEQFVGALLVEEPDFPYPENQVNLTVIQATRERRIEIITGIAQQVALAIQNEQLERETIEREKIEREMQLAREIQQTFLPQKLPEPPGWDFEVLWRTARQVGGDFYDIVELPEGRLGLVVADVADKGMPAALWMTMIRTLLHATLRQMDSPVEVLAYLNHVLVPDTRNGMFASMLFGVLNLKSGEFFYANAGHNPPILLSAQTRQVSYLDTGGVVLGVMNEIVLPGRRLTLSPGDGLILYTDGITEVFSPDGKIFGEERLKLILEDTLPVYLKVKGKTSLQTILGTIDAALEDFSGGAALSDDQTILVFRRQ